MGYVFDPKVLGECVSRGIGLPVDEAMDTITAALLKSYPDDIYGGPRRWIFNNAGGAMGQLTLLHASLNEYLIFFGSPIGTEGHSGRYTTEVYDWVFDGQMWCYVEGETERTLYDPGSTAHLGRGQVKGYRIPDRAWMLEYARGSIPTMLPFGLADSFLSTLDFRAVGRTVADYGRLTVGSLVRHNLPARAVKLLPRPVEALLRGKS